MAAELPSDPDSLLTAAELARYLRVKATVFRQMMKAGSVLRPTIFAGRRPLWRVGDVRAWLQLGGVGWQNCSFPNDSAQKGAKGND